MRGKRIKDRNAFLTFAPFVTLPSLVVARDLDELLAKRGKIYTLDHSRSPSELSKCGYAFYEFSSTEWLSFNRFDVTACYRHGGGGWLVA